MTDERGFGMAAAVPLETVLAAAHEAQDSGYTSFWLNNPPGADALSALSSVSAAVPQIELGVGVIPLAHTPPEEIVARLKELNLPKDRLLLGVGSGSGGVETVASGIEAIRKEWDGTVVIAALGPRMLKLGGTSADGVLLNWLTPEWARHSVQTIREAAGSAGREMPSVWAYVRVALGDEAGARLRKEADGYSRNTHYAAHFRRMGADAMQTAVAASTPEEVQAALSAWNGIVDGVVVRCITAHDSLAQISALLKAAAPQSR